MKTLVLLLFSILLPPMWPQSPSSNPREQVVLLEQRWLAIVDNPNALESILADDFVHVLPTGIITKRQQLAYMRSHPRNRHVRRRFDDLNVRIFGNAAVATGTVIAVGEDGAERKTYFTDVFANRNGDWQAVTAQETSAQVSNKN